MSSAGRRLLTAISLVLVATAYWWASSEPVATDSDESSTSSDESVAGNTSGALQVQQLPTGNTIVAWHSDTSKRYRFDIDSSMRMQTESSSLSEVMSVSMSGVMDQVVLDAQGREALLGIMFSEVQLKMAGQSESALADSLHVPFRVRYVSGGVPLAGSLQFAQSVDSDVRAILENILLTFQVSIPDSSTQWTADESNASGTYTADYRRIGFDGIAKSKVEFTAHADGNTMLAQAQVQSNESIILDPKNDAVSAMRISESLTAPGHNGPAVELTSQATLDIIDGENSPLNKDLWSFAAANMIAQVSGAVSTASPQLSLAQAHDRLDAELLQLDDATENRTRHIHRLRDLLKMHGALAGLLVQQLTDDQWSERTRADMYLALELAGTVDAQLALSSIFSDPAWSDNDSIRAIIALSGVANPQPEAMSALWNTTATRKQQLSSTALFALGSMGATLADAADAEYETLRDNLVNGAQSTADPNRRADFVSALGNTRDSDVATDITGMLGDAEPVVRRAAAQALALVGSQDSAISLMDTFKTERSSRVRAAVVETMTTLSIADADTMQLMSTELTTEQDEKTRYAMAGYLADKLPDFPEYEISMRQHLRQEASKRVRQRLAEALARMGN